MTYSPPCFPQIKIQCFGASVLQCFSASVLFSCRFWTAYSVRPTFVKSTTELSLLLYARIRPVWSVIISRTHRQTDTQWVSKGVDNFFSWRFHDLKWIAHGHIICGTMVYSFQVMRATGKKVIEKLNKNFEILKKWKTHFCQKTDLIVLIVPSRQNNSWWDRVGGPVSVEKSQKSLKTAEIQKKWKISVLSEFSTFSTFFNWFRLYYSLPPTIDFVIWCYSH